MKERLNWIDNLKGFGMILVVWGHFFPPIEMKQWIYAFHMPLFFFISGYLSKDRTIKETFKAKSKSLLLPYFITAFLSIPISIVLDKGLGNSISLSKYTSDFFYLNGSVGLNSPIWFFIVLFIVEMMFSIFKSKRQKIISGVLFFVIGYFIYLNQIILPFGLHIVLWVYPIYILGMLIRCGTLVDYFEKNSKTILIVPVLLLINLILNSYQKVVTEIYHSELGHFFIYYLNLIIMILAVLIIFVKLKKRTGLTFFSTHSLFIMTTHYLFYYFYMIVWKVLFRGSALIYDLGSSVIKLLFCLLSYWILFFILSKVKKRLSRN